MVNLNGFYDQCCEEHSEDEVLLKTDFEKIKINIEDVEFKDIRYTTVKNVVRFLNPKVDLRKIFIPEIATEELPSTDDFDEAVRFLKANEVKETSEEMSDDIKKMFFLPSHIEAKLKGITCGNQRNKIDSRLEKILTEDFITSLELNFKFKSENDIVEYDKRKKCSLSLFKFYKYDDNNECDTLETELMINHVKYKLNPQYIESFEKYFIGNIEVEVGLIERDSSEHNKKPLYYHLNFWKLYSSDLESITKNFRLYPFNKEVLLSEF